MNVRYIDLGEIVHLRPGERLDMPADYDHYRTVLGVCEVISYAKRQQALDVGGNLIDALSRVYHAKQLEMAAEDALRHLIALERLAVKE